MGSGSEKTYVQTYANIHKSLINQNVRYRWQCYDADDLCGSLKRIGSESEKTYVQTYANIHKR